MSVKKESRNRYFPAPNPPTEDPGLIQITFLNQADIPKPNLHLKLKFLFNIHQISNPDAQSITVKVCLDCDYPQDSHTREWEDKCTHPSMTSMGDL